MTPLQTSTPHTKATRREPWVAVAEAMVDAAGQRHAFEHDEHFHLSIPNAPYMRLVVEAWDVPTGTYDGRPVGMYGGTARRVISLAHYAEKESPLDDAIVDTDVEFLDDGRILNLTGAYGQMFSRVRWLYCGEVKVDRVAERDTNSFVRMWARNIRHQGFVQAARRLADQPDTHNEAGL